MDVHCWTSTVGLSKSALPHMVLRFPHPPRTSDLFQAFSLAGRTYAALTDTQYPLQNTSVSTTVGSATDMTHQLPHKIANPLGYVG